MKNYWVGLLSLDDNTSKTVLFDPACQYAKSSLVKLYISELNRVVHYKKDLVRPNLKKLHADDLSSITAINCYEKFKQRPVEHFHREYFLDSDHSHYYDDGASLELLNELYDDACDYARSEEEGWFYSDTDSDSESIPG